MKGTGAVPVQLDRTKGNVAISLDGYAATATRSGSQPVSTLGLESAGNGYTPTFQADSST